MEAGAGQQSADLVDVLFALTAFEFEAFSVGNRTTKSVEALIQALVELAVNRYRSNRQARRPSAI